MKNPSKNNRRGRKMKPKISILLLLVCLLCSYVSAQEFGYPAQGEGWYYIEVMILNTSETKNQTWKITKVLVNDIQVRDFLVYQLDREIYDKKIHGDWPFDLKIRHNWVGEKEYKIQVELMNTESESSIILEKNTKSPAFRGYWDTRWKNYLTLSLSEESKCKRTNYPVHATVGILSHYFHAPEEIRVVKVKKKGMEVTYSEIPCQVYDIKQWEDQDLLSAEEIDEETGKRIDRYHPTTTFSLCFLADLKPKEDASYVVFYNNPSAPKPLYETDLQISGEGLGKTIENSHYKIVLDGTSGMILEIYEKNTGLKLEHKLETNGAVHWNPGTYSPPHSWYHCSDWENPPFSEVQGPIFYSIHRAAPLPHLEDIMVSIDYHFYKSSPVILMESTLQVMEDLFVKALRNGEIVFNKEVFDKAAYRTVMGKIQTIDLAHTRMHPEHVITLRPDTPWIALYNEEKDIAFASLFLELSTSNIYGGGASLQQPYIYIQNGPWYYMARAFVYSFGSNNQSRMLPANKGSIYHEKIAWIPFSFQKKKAMRAYIQKYFNMYKYPLSITEIIETYPESPEGWLVPILTEPFEEGVEDALKGKKKK
jgi:hypothetical protein